MSQNIPPFPSIWSLFASDRERTKTLMNSPLLGINVGSSPGKYCVRERGRGGLWHGWLLHGEVQEFEEQYCHLVAEKQHADLQYCLWSAYQPYLCNSLNLNNTKTYRIVIKFDSILYPIVLPVHNYLGWKHTYKVNTITTFTNIFSNPLGGVVHESGRNKPTAGLVILK